MSEQYAVSVIWKFRITNPLVYNNREMGFFSFCFLYFFFSFFNITQFQDCNIDLLYIVVTILYTLVIKLFLSLRWHYTYYITLFTGMWNDGKHKNYGTVLNEFYNDYRKTDKENKNKTF